MVDNLIRLFDSAETDFYTNGIGILSDAESCIVTEEKNGEFELELVYPINGRRFSDISMRRIIVAKSNPYSNPQPFRIYSITKPFNGRVTVNAQHISYDMSGYPIPPFSATSCTDAFDKMKEACPVDCPFEFWTDKDVTKEYSTSKPYSMRSLLGGVDGSILNAFGKGEYEFDGYLVKFWLNRGKDRGVSIRYGKNLTDLKQEENCSSVYTGVYPYWYSEDRGNVTLPEGIVETDGTYNYVRILTLDLSDKWTEKPKEDELRTAAQNYIKNNKVGVPDVSLDISFEQLAQTNEYELYSLLEEVHLCDTVHVEFPELGVSAKSDCIKTTYDVLTDKYKKIELGSAKTNLATTIANQEKNIEETLSKTYLEQAVDRATKLISGNSGGYVVMRSSDGNKFPNEILIMDTNDISTAKKVWRWNSNGLGYSNIGYNGPYGLAMTIDGEINADYISTGILNAISIRACDIKCGKIEETVLKARMRAAAEEKYAFELSSNGEIRATKGTIGKCEIDSEGKLIVPAAHISGLLVASQIDASELKVGAANITGILQVSQIDTKNLFISADQVDISGKSLSLTLKDYATTTGGEDSSFSYSLTPAEFTLKANDKTILKATKTGIDITGQITANGGKISNLIIGDGELYFSSAGINAKDSYTKQSLVSSGMSPVRFYSGSGDRISGKFVVLNDGSLYAEAAKITGNITSSAGNIGGWEISSSGFTKTETNGGISTTVRLQTAYGSGIGIGDVSTIKPVIEVVYNNTSKFYVRRNGFLHAEDADISGKITASSGTIAGMKIWSGTATILNNITVNDANVLETKDGSFKIISYNQNGESKSHILVDYIEFGTPVFNKDFQSTSFTAFDKLKVGSYSIHNDGLLKKDDEQIMTLNREYSGEVVNVSVSFIEPNNNVAEVKYENNKKLSEDREFIVLVKRVGGKIETRTVKIPANANSGTAKIGDWWLGYEKPYFKETGTKSCQIVINGIKYIEVDRNFGPWWDNKYDLGKDNYKWRNIYGSTGTIISSDRNLKKDIAEISDKYDELFDRLKPVTYKFIQNTSDRTHIGFIAQDIKQIIDELNISSKDFAAYCDWKKEDGTTGYALRYGEFVALNTYEIQKLKKRMVELETQLQNK